MKCPACSKDSPEGMKFCGACGAQLSIHCSRCRSSNPPEFKFCGECGNTLVGLDNSSSSATVAAPADAERRQLTVMFCDLVGSTELSERLDPEELRELLQQYQRVSGQVVESFEGHIAQYLGDGILVYFGFPRAHEDDALRAVRSGLDIIVAMADWNRRLEQELRPRLAVRIGVHTGPVVTGAIGAGERKEFLALGQTPNLAARLQGLAAPGSVLLSADTYHLVQGYIACEQLGAKTLKGTSRPMIVYRALHQESDVHHRVDLAISRDLTPLVGRQQELSKLLGKFEEISRNGAGSAVLLTGEAGIGKSRLAYRVRRQIAQRNHRSLICYCSAYAQSSAFHPLVKLLRELCDFQREDPPKVKQRKAEALLSSCGMTGKTTLTLFAGLLALPMGKEDEPLDLTPQRHKERTLEVLLAVLLGQAKSQPVLLVVEDLHWADPSTLEFLERLIAALPTSAFFAVLTSRPSFDPTWGPELSLNRLELGKLNESEIRNIIDNVTGGKTLPPEIISQIVQKTDGVPLFVEELTKMVLESVLLREGEHAYELTGALGTRAIPTTIQDSLMARLDRLGASKRVVQLGSVLGRVFSYEMLKSVSPWDEKKLRRDLSSILPSGLLVQRGDLPRARFFFKHALIQDTAYNSLLKRTRRAYHLRIAEAMIEQSESSETRPELVAYHYTEAKQTEPAIGYWQKAGESALRRSANLEALQHLRRGLELLAELPEDRERLRTELRLQTTLGPALQATKGHTAPEVERAYRRALDLCRQIRDAPEIYWALAGLGVYYQTRGELHRGLKMAEEMLRLAEDAQNHEMTFHARFGLGSTCFFLGDLEGALEHLTWGISASRSSPRSNPSNLALDTHLGYRHLGSNLNWQLGYPERALALCAEALSMARASGRPLSIATSVTYSAWQHQLRREPEAVKILAEEALGICTEHGFPLWIPWLEVFLGWALAHQGEVNEGLKHIQSGLAASQAAGSRATETYLTAVHAEVLLSAGRLEDSLRAVELGLEAVAARKERFWEAELCRLKGELLLTLSDTQPGEAEQLFRQAAETARRQGARTLEVRALLSLGRLEHE